MPSIVVVANTDEQNASEFQLKELVSAPLLTDPHYCGQLLERIRWAVEDAWEAERTADRAQDPARADRPGAPSGR